MSHVLVSGGFDPPHYGHYILLMRACQLAGSGGQVTVAVMSDEWLVRKNGYVAMTVLHRASMMGAMAAGISRGLASQGLTKVMSVIDIHQVAPPYSDMGAVLTELGPDIFLNGNDYSETMLPEAERLAARDMDIKLDFSAQTPDHSAALRRRIIAGEHGVKSSPAQRLTS